MADVDGYTYLLVSCTSQVEPRQPIIQTLRVAIVLGVW